VTRQATRAALLDQVWPDGTELIVLPPGLPRTKRRALNYGLARAQGAYVVVYDAEDRPDPRQLRDAVAAFARGQSSLACVQAPLVGAPEGCG
jgi:glycosyltransferase XagB